MYFFRTFKKSTAPYKVQNMGLRYIKFKVKSDKCIYHLSRCPRSNGAQDLKGQQNKLKSAKKFKAF